MKFKELVCIITGGSGGLGNATAIRLLELGSKVMIFDLQQPKYELDYGSRLSFQKVECTQSKMHTAVHLIYKKQKD